MHSYAVDINLPKSAIAQVLGRFSNIVITAHRMTEEGFTLVYEASCDRAAMEFEDALFEEAYLVEEGKANAQRVDGERVVCVPVGWQDTEGTDLLW